MANTKDLDALRARITSFAKSAAPQDALKEPDSIQDVKPADAKAQPDASKEKQKMPADGSNSGSTKETTLPGAAGVNATGDGSNAPSAGSAAMISGGNDTKLANTSEEIAKRASASVARVMQFITAPAKSDGSKTAADGGIDNITMHEAFLQKLAMTMLATEEGKQLVTDHLTKLSGVAAAREMVKAACEGAEAVFGSDLQAEEMEKQAAFAQQQYLAELSQQFHSQSPEDQATTLKLANALEVIGRELETMPEKYALISGAQDGAFYAERVLTKRAASIPGLPEGGGAPGGAPGGEMPPGAEGGGQQLDPQLVAQVVEALVQSGELDPETAQHILQQFAGGEGTAEEDATGGGMPPSPEEQEATQMAGKAASAVDKVLAAA